jgi:hypothetical protein
MTPSVVIPSTFFLTALLMIGLFFFVRASTKDRIECLEWSSSEEGDRLLSQIEQHLTQRAYRLKQVEPEQSKVIFEGLVRPSVILAALLVSLVIVSLLGLSLVLSLTMPSVGLKFMAIGLVSPLAGWFYWKGSERLEEVEVQVLPPEPSSESNPKVTEIPQTTVRVQGHRDELLALRNVLGV